MPEIINPKIQKYLKPVIWAIILGIIFLFHFNHYLSADEGVTLNGAWNLYNGQIMYKDFFAFIPPASFYLIFIFWKIFGPSFLVAKLFAIFSIFFGAIGVYYDPAETDVFFISWNVVFDSGGSFFNILYRTCNSGSKTFSHFEQGESSAHQHTANGDGADDVLPYLGDFV